MSSAHRTTGGDCPGGVEGGGTGGSIRRIPRGSQRQVLCTGTREGRNPVLGFLRLPTISVI